MAITVTMIEEKEFKTKMRGYDPLEVDEFLDEICDEMCNMQEEIISLQSRLAKSGTRLFTPAAPAPAPAPIPSAAVPAPAVLSQPEPAEKKDDAQEAARLLKNAQKVYDDTIADAKREAQKILDDAKAKLGDEDIALLKDKTMIEEEIAHLKETAKKYRDRVLQLMDEQKSVLDSASDLFDEE